MNDSIILHHGDCKEVLRGLNESSVDSVVTDPPYGLSKEPNIVEVLTHWMKGDDYKSSGGGFMGKSWDSFVPGPATWKEVFRVLKPGGHLLCFAGSRTVDLMGISLRMAGFEIRDQIQWVYGSGFPKSLDVSKALDKAAGAERKILDVDPVRFARLKNQTNGSISTGEQWEHGKRDVNITAPATDAARQWQGWGTALKPAHEPIIVARKPLVGTVAANVLQFGTGALNIDGCRVGDEVRINPPFGVDGWRRQEERVDRQDTFEKPVVGRFPANLIHDGSDEVLACFPDVKGQQGATAERSQGQCYSTVTSGQTGIPPRINQSTSAARFFYCAKTSKSDRGETNTHATVKPTDLMRYLCRLVTPPGGVVLDPFAGSGSTGKAATLEGFYSVLIEQDIDHITIIRDRLNLSVPKLSFL